jgi:phosphatidylserine/phosphatidylglycerophosphate/cardiolipin synthase-like enzyme
MDPVTDADNSASTDWLLDFTTMFDPTAGDGRPWGDGTAIAARAAAGQPPWDPYCQATPMVDGFETMNAIRETFEAAIADANGRQNLKPGQRGYVYIAGLQFNALRDLSVDNSWRGGPWNGNDQAINDQTALGLALRMMSAGIVVRLLLWMPTTAQDTTAEAIGYEHWRVAAAIQDHDNSLRAMWKSLAPPLIGVVALDLRTAGEWTATLHQKMIVVRVGDVNEAFCGGVDLAFTRRDFGMGPGDAIGEGDWQSGDSTPDVTRGWPKQDPPPFGGYPNYPYDNAGGRFPEDLCQEVYANPPERLDRHWHDHHLHLRGPIVAQLEHHFAERWIMDVQKTTFGTKQIYLFDRYATDIGPYAQVQLTSKAAIGPGPPVLPLPDPAPVRIAGNATIQLWRTIPLRPGVDKGPLKRGEFTVMAGIANAVSKATYLITIFDQYFWSVPLARLLTNRVNKVPTLRLLIVLPPFGTSLDLVSTELWFRCEALQALWKGLTDDGRRRTKVLDMWASGTEPGTPGAPNHGVYVHAKSQTYDDQLLVCGSANLNRRSLMCDAELDIAVAHTPTTKAHLANVYQHLTGKPWTDYLVGWSDRWWEQIEANGRRALIKDPFFAATVPALPKTPNGVGMPRTRPSRPGIYEPSSVNEDIDHDDPMNPKYPCSGLAREAAGRLDGVSYLLERCHEGPNWRYRVPADRWIPETEPSEAPPVPTEFLE